MLFFIYQLTDGLVVARGSVPDHELQHQQVPDGCVIREGYAELGQVFRDSEVVSIADPAREWTKVRARRDALLTACDWTQLPDVPLTTRSAWAVYRQALRDITLQPDPFNITWPAAS